jgi:hypothetical protein
VRLEELGQLKNPRKEIVPVFLIKELLLLFLNVLLAQVVIYASQCTETYLLRMMYLQMDGYCELIYVDFFIEALSRNRDIHTEFQI